MWYRAQVDQLVEDDHASLFFVDHGDKARVSISDIAPITEMLIKKLPFQAIECSLAGIKPPDGGTWSAEATDVMYEFCDNSYGLYVKVCELMTAAVCTGGSKYKVMLVDNTSTNVDVYLNSVLLEKNLALPDNIEQILETLDPVGLEGGDTSEESDVEPEETRIVELSDISVPQHSQVNAASASAADSISDDEEYDILVDDPLEFLMEMMRGNKKCEPSLPAVPALPSPSSLPSSDDHNLEGASASCISPQHLSSNDKSDIDCIPPLVSTARTPQVLWHQDECIIYIKIMLTGVQKYYIGWDVMHLQFSTQMKSQVYEVMLELYSSVNVSSISHTAKGFFVHIKMMKTVTGFSWPRLLQSQCKRPWLKLDLEKYKGDFDSDEDNAKTRCERALKELSLSNKESQVPAPNLKDEAVISSVPISSSDDDEEEEEEDGMNLQDESYDPFDPLS
ncbi:hypothetical protein B7P43_G02372 [Cryptotermes secundus]|uniref:RNA helicase n=5 Tax=Cryptotermes secundus TaxID=105785 RepID=A0A2J7RB22_9NEOP|nr:hypothetical protein B7P43_G02372 [Cryptotermes secundus]